jgi:hypothetical protein
MRWEGCVANISNRRDELDGRNIWLTGDRRL